MTIPDVAELAPFARCRRTELDRIRTLLTPIMLPIGATIIEQGSRPRQFAVIADGEVSVEAPDGREVAVLGPGSVVGELGLLRDVPTGATVRTLTPVIAYVANRWEFRTMLEIAPSVDAHVVHVALERTRQVS